MFFSIQFFFFPIFNSLTEFAVQTKLEFRIFRTRDDYPIEKSEKYRIAQSKNAVQLALDHVQKEDAGKYTLFARTKSGKVARKDIELVVEDRSSGDDPPSFLRRLTDLSVKVGTRTRLLVEIRSSSATKVSFHFI